MQIKLQLALLHNHLNRTVEGEDVGEEEEGEDVGEEEEEEEDN